MSEIQRRSWSCQDEILAETQSHKTPMRRVFLLIVVPITGLILLALIAFAFTPANQTSRLDALKKLRQASPRVVETGHLIDWWDEIPNDVMSRVVHSVGESNIHPDDYVGPESCKSCHQENYDAWSTHPHRWMNALATATTVKGDFSGDATISYRGGLARFFKKDDEYRMQLERGDVLRVYQITQTIGSRFFQYYIGKLLVGPEPQGHEFYTTDHVLPFGYWFDEKQWIPVVHTYEVPYNGELISEDEVPEQYHSDPFAEPNDSFAFMPYHRCNQCHTTFALGDLFLTAPNVIGRHSPLKMHFDMSDYIGDTHPQLWDASHHPAEISDQQLMPVMQSIVQWEAPDHAVTLGISCEACHMGLKRHAENEQSKPLFFPNSPHLHLEAHDKIDFGRTHDNINWICGRCHVGDRPQLAAGMATWNSTEYSDAMRGSCYSKLRCIDCHDPHQATGPKWTQTPEQEDQKCTACHQQFQSADAIAAHSHHAAGSEGSHCMNCHMPRLNEGLQDVVRTHMILSPTNRDMIQANQPNACNQCHTRQSIQWTLDHLKSWYGAKFDNDQIAANYPHRGQPTALGWLESENSSVRLVAADTLARTKSRWALPQLIDALDDPFLLNRQFTAKAIEKMLDIDLKEFDYRFYMTPDERREPLTKIRAALLK